MKKRSYKFPINYSELVPVINLRAAIKNFFEKSDITISGKKILDVGCGTGYFTKYFKENGYDVDGFDIDDTNIKQARKLYPDINNFRKSDFSNSFHDSFRLYS